MKRLFFLTLSTVIFFSSGYTQNSDTAIIRRLNRDWLNAIIHHDSASLANILADDFILINPAGIRRTKADNVSHMHQPGQQVTSITIDSEDLRWLSDNVAIITAWTTNYITEHDKKIVVKICYMDIYQKRNKKWKAVAAHVSLLK